MCLSARDNSAAALGKLLGPVVKEVQVLRLKRLADCLLMLARAWRVLPRLEQVALVRQVPELRALQVVAEEGLAPCGLMLGAKRDVTSRISDAARAEHQGKAHNLHHLDRLVRDLRCCVPMLAFALTLHVCQYSSS